MIRLPRTILGALLFAVVILVGHLVAGTIFVGKCVSVSSAGSLGVLRDGKVVRVRLAGIECPDGHQEFGIKANRYVRALAQGEEVTVNVIDSERAGGLVGYVAVDNRDLSTQLIRDGFAWYRKEAIWNDSLAQAEMAARTQKIGMWSRPNAEGTRPAPPDTTQGKPKSRSRAFAAASSIVPVKNAVYVTKGGKRYHARNCRFVRKGARALSREQALADGYKACGRCKP